MSYSMEDLIAKYIELRAHKAEIEARHKEELSEVKESMTLLENVFNLHMIQNKTLNINTAKGTAYRSGTISITRKDMPEFIKFAYENDEELLDIRPCKTGIKKFLEDPDVIKKKIVIPGIQIDYIATIGVRKK